MRKIINYKYTDWSIRINKILIFIFVLASLTACSGPDEGAIRREVPVKPAHLDDSFALNLQQTVESLREDGNYQEYGFENKHELDAAILGRTLPTYVLTPQAVRAYQKGQPISSLLLETSRWMAPVLVNQEVKNIMFVDQMGDFISFGGGANDISLPQEYDEPAITVRYFEQPQIRAQFLLLEQEDSEKLFLLRPLGFNDALDPMAHKLIAPEEMMLAIKQAVNEKCTIFFFYREC